MTQKFIISIAWGFCLLTAATHVRAALTISQPTASTVVPAGDDYATQVLGNAWDMADAIDIDTEESYAVNSQSFSSGVFSGATTANGANIYPLFMGYASSINLSRGANFPIDTWHYRYVTYKLRVNQPSQPQFTRVIGIEDGGSYGATPKATLVETFYSAPLPSNVWIIPPTFDMVSNNDGVYYHWLDFPQVAGLRIDPATTNVGGTYAVAPFDIDWIRLTAPATAAQKTPVQWSDSISSTYTISAIDTAGTGTSFTLATGVSGTSYQADTSFLPPGQYQIQVSRAGATANSPTFRINSPPQIAITAPSVRGEQTLSFAQAVVGNPWGPMDASDVSLSNNLTNISYTNPAGSFYGRPTTFDPNLFLNLAGNSIDTSLYRSLCFTMEVFGPRSIGSGSVARVFWGNSLGALTTSRDIILDDNLSDTRVSEYCIPDLAAAPLEANPNGGTWSGTKAVLRLDPHELPVSAACTNTPSPDNCHDVRLDSVVLSPFAAATPAYTVRWTLTDPDFTGGNGGSLGLFLDPDKIYGNGNEIPVALLPYALGAGQYGLVADQRIPNGTYNVVVVADDGTNVVVQYAGGPIITNNADVIFRNGFDPLP